MILRNEVEDNPTLRIDSDFMKKTIQQLQLLPILKRH